MLKQVSSHKCFDGQVSYWEHQSISCGTSMRFSVFEPPQISKKSVPVIYYLGGLTCSEETFMIKAGAQQYASNLGIMLVSPDTSPRNTGIEGEDETWTFGSGAGFYLDSTKEPWSKHFKMFTYVTEELPDIIANNFSAKKGFQSIFGHSMGGHGSLIAALKKTNFYSSVSAFAPIASLINCDWGYRALEGYLGDSMESWVKWDATELMKHGKSKFDEILIAINRDL